MYKPRWGFPQPQGKTLPKNMHPGHLTPYRNCSWGSSMSSYCSRHPSNRIYTGVHQQRLQLAEDTDVDTGTWHWLRSFCFEREDHCCTWLQQAELNAKPGSWNHRMFGAGRDLRDYIVQTPLPQAGNLPHHGSGSHWGSLFLQHTILFPDRLNFPGHSNQISLITNVILFSWSDYQTEIGIQIAFLLLPCSTFALQPCRQRAQRAIPVFLLSRKGQVKQQAFKCASTVLQAPEIKLVVTNPQSRVHFLSWSFQ